MIRFYLDENAHGDLPAALREKGLDVLTVEEDGLSGAVDPIVFERAQALGRVLFTQDKDFLRMGPEWQRDGKPFLGIIYAHQRRVDIGDCVADLATCAGAGGPKDFANLVTHLPL